MRRVNHCLWLFAFALMVGAHAADADVARYQGVRQGGIVATGNSLGLSKASSSNAPGTLGSIGTFMAAGSGSTDGTYPTGTTSDWTADASDAVLALPSGSEVIYAELVWGGSFQYGTEDVSASLDTSATLSFGAASTSVAPAAQTAVTLSATATAGYSIRYYTRSADVTTFVAAHGAGTYRVGHVPGTQADAINSLNAAGWSLVVVYGNGASPPRFVSLVLGANFVDTDSQHDYLFSGFCAPASGTVAGSVVISALEGDADATGDQLVAGPTGGTFTAMSGTTNPENNFFASQIVGSDGSLDTSGTFGTANHDASAGTNAVGGRQGWDVTTVPMTAGTHLTNGQTTLTVRAITTDDAFVPALAGVGIDVDAPRFSTQGATTLTQSSIAVGTTTTLTIALDNSGGAPATNVQLRLPLPDGLALVELSIDGVQVASADLTTGVDIGTIVAGSSKSVTITIRGDVAGSFTLAPQWSYGFQICAGSPLEGQATSQSVTLSVPQPESPDAGVSPDAGSNTDPATSGNGSGGCCRVGSTSGRDVAPLVLVVVVCVSRRRRARLSRAA